MTDAVISITETIALTVLRSFLLSVVSCEVLRAQVNQVAMPKGDVIYMTPRSFVALSTPVDNYSNVTKTLLRPVQFTVQLDFYGTLAADRCNTVNALLRDQTATDFFINSGYDMQTLYAGDANQLPLITGEKQYLERWTMDAVLQLNPVINLTTQTANTLTAGVINVGVAYPA